MATKSPSDPEEAKERLADIVRQMQSHLDEYQPHETFVSVDLMDWFIAAANDHLAGKSSLEQGLGLARTRGRPKDKDGEGRYFTLALKVYEMRGHRFSWSKIADALDYDSTEIRRIYNRNEPAVLKHIAKRVSVAVGTRRKGIKSRHLTAKTAR